MKRILVCLDGSPRAPKLLATAIDLATRLDARLTLFRAIGLPSEATTEAHAQEDLAAQLIEEAKRELFALSRDVPEDRFAGLDVKIGVPWDAICHEAARLEADTILIGSHGYRGLDRVLGTTAAKVVNHAHCTVVVVR